MNNNNIPSYKIILLGESSVGKTSIIQRITKDTFSDLTLSTISAYYTEKKLEINGVQIKLEIWDTAGQERFRSVARNYYNGCDAAILVYDITDKKSFDELIDYWYKEVKEHCPDIILGLSGNKFDLFEHEQITEKEGKELANQLKAIFYSTSAKENVGIDALIKDIGKELLEKNDRTISFNNDTLNATKLSTETLIQKKKCC